NNKNRKEFFNQYFKFYDGRDPFKSASQFMSEIRAEIESSDKIRRVVVFGIGLLNTYTGLKGEVLEFLQVLIKYFKEKKISSIYIDWFRSTDIQETLPTEKAQEFIGNQIDIRLDEVRKDDKDNPIRKVYLERKEHRFSTHQYIGDLNLKDNKLFLNDPKAEILEEHPFSTYQHIGDFYLKDNKLFLKCSKDLPVDKLNNK
ncbi:MAG: hypothetical protein K8S16_02650, partial [Bacteroidales bacterium]|nr:hypothetical protein [Bacteroidales bacterium]